MRKSILGNSHPSQHAGDFGYMFFVTRTLNREGGDRSFFGFWPTISAMLIPESTSSKFLFGLVLSVLVSGFSITGVGAEQDFDRVAVVRRLRRKL